MIHLLQSYTEKETWNGSALNREVEAHLLQQMYINSLPESEQIWWLKITKYDPRQNSIRELVKYFKLSGGELKDDFTNDDLQQILENRVINDLHRTGYDSINYPWLISRKGISNFENLVKILHYGLKY